MLSRFLNAFYDFLQELGKAKAASHLARMGKHKEAQAIMASK